MSIEAMNAVAKMRIEPSGRKFVAMALANFADENWACFPSSKKLAEWTSQGEKTVRRHLDDLEQSGFLARERLRREDGTLGIYRYFIQRPILPEANLASGQNFHSPAANLATHNHQSYPSIKHTNNAGARGTRLPDDWEPSQADLDYALNTGWTMEHVRIEATKFRNYWTSKTGKDATKKNWHRTWQNWCLNAFPHKRAPQAPPRKRTVSDAANDLLKEMRNERSEAEGDHRIIELVPANGGRY